MNAIRTALFALLLFTATTDAGCTTPLALGTPTLILAAPTISGGFANAANGATFASNGDSYRVSYRRQHRCQSSRGNR